MSDRTQFSEAISTIAKSHLFRAIAFIWFYRETGEHQDRTAAELANDLHEEDFAKPRVPRLHAELTNDKRTVKGARPKSFKLNLSYVAGLDKIFGDLVKQRRKTVTDSVLPVEWFTETSKHFAELVRQINGSYDAGFYDGCAVLMRRLMECLLIETYVRKSRSDEIKVDGNFRPLDWLWASGTSGKSAMIVPLLARFRVAR